MDLNTTLEVFHSLVNTSQIEIQLRFIQIKISFLQYIDIAKLSLLSKFYDIRDYVWQLLKDAIPLLLSIIRYLLFKLADFLLILLVEWRNHLVAGTIIFLGAVYLWYQNANKPRYHVQALEQCYLDLAILISSKDCHPILLRLAWSDAATYDQSIRDWPRCGGTNASIRFDRNLSHPSNAGLEKALQYLRPLKKKYRNISWSDMIQMAGSLAVELAGGPSMQGKMRYGRVDALVPLKSESQFPSTKAKPQNASNHNHNYGNSHTQPYTSRSTGGVDLNTATNSPSYNLRESTSSGIITPRSAVSSDHLNNADSNNHPNNESNSSEQHSSRIHKRNSHSRNHSRNPSPSHTNSNSNTNSKGSNVNTVRSNLFHTESNQDSDNNNIHPSRNSITNGGQSDQISVIPRLPLPFPSTTTHNHLDALTARSDVTEYTASGVGVHSTSRHTDGTARSSSSVLSQYMSARPTTSHTDHHSHNHHPHHPHHHHNHHIAGKDHAKSKGTSAGGTYNTTIDSGRYMKEKPINNSSSSTKDTENINIQCEASRLPVAEPPYPNGVPTADAHVRHVFYRMGFKNKEIVALCGAHTLGRGFKDRSGVCEFASGDANATKYTNQNWCAKANGITGIGMAGGCSWTKNWLQFDNSYFKRIHDVLKESEKGADEASANTTNDLLWLSTDMALYKSSEFRPYFMRYLNDENAFFEDYSDAHKKMSELGAKFHPVGGIVLGHVDIKKYINK